MPQQERPNCFKCVHFRFSAQPEAPYICKVFEMRSSRIPSLMVLQQSGSPCQLMEEKASNSADRETPGSLQQDMLDMRNPSTSSGIDFLC